MDSDNAQQNPEKSPKNSKGNPRGQKAKNPKRSPSATKRQYLDIIPYSNFVTRTTVNMKSVYNL